MSFIHYAALLFVSLASPALADPPPTTAASPKILSGTSADTDQPLWRATHGVLLAVARAGSRIVAAGDRGIIILSDNGGRDWKQVPTGSDALLTSLAFTSASEGFAVGQDATILHTADAGATWTSQHAAPASDQALFSAAILGPNHLIATGAYALALETTDARSWTEVKLPNLDEDYHLNCATARGEDVVITGEAGHAFLRHAGAWSPLPVPYQGSQFGCLTLKDGTVLSFGLRGSLFALAPAAIAWKRLDTGEQRAIFGGAVLADGTIAMVGGNGLAMIFDMATGRARTLPPPTGATLSGVAETGDGHWAVVGEDGVHLVDPKADGSATQ